MTKEKFLEMLQDDYDKIVVDDRITSINTLEKPEYDLVDLRDDEISISELMNQCDDVQQGFRGKYFFLSNMSYSPFVMNGHWFLSAEHAFHFWKCKYAEDARKFEAGNPESIESPYEARKAGRQVIKRDNWIEIRVRVMKSVLEAKFSQNEELIDRLVNTSGVLCEYNSWGDSYWGKSMIDGHYKGRNMLGKLLTELRDAYIASGDYEVYDATLRFEHQNFTGGYRSRETEEIASSSLHSMPKKHKRSEDQLMDLVSALAEVYEKLS